MDLKSSGCATMKAEQQSCGNVFAKYDHLQVRKSAKAKEPEIVPLPCSSFC